MLSTQETTGRLITSGYLEESNREAAQSLLAPYQKAAADAFSTKNFALVDKAYQAKVVQGAQELAESDLDMDQIEDRFIQAGVIDSAASLSEKDHALFEKADAMLVAACGEAAADLLDTGLIDGEDLEAVTRLIAGLWNPTVEDES